MHGLGNHHRVRVQVHLLRVLRLRRLLGILDTQHALRGEEDTVDPLEAPLLGALPPVRLRSRHSAEVGLRHDLRKRWRALVDRARPIELRQHLRGACIHARPPGRSLTPTVVAGADVQCGEPAPRDLPRLYHQAARIYEKRVPVVEADDIVEANLEGADPTQWPRGLCAERGCEEGAVLHGPPIALQSACWLWLRLVLHDSQNKTFGLVAATALAASPKESHRVVGGCEAPDVESGEG
mmetsp:Transcript_89662/g.192136  ORF Transcript_89662/g.192136 Transcript_89662/m.192136 type:complete len:238 (+) Transcript_89662:2151-2864(+)